MLSSSVAVREFSRGIVNLRLFPDPWPPAATSAPPKEYLGQYWWSWGVRPFANDIAGAINRCNYNQRNSQLNALAGKLCSTCQARHAIPSPATLLPCLGSILPAAGRELWAVQGSKLTLLSVKALSPESPQTPPTQALSRFCLPLAGSCGLCREAIRACPRHCCATPMRPCTCKRPSRASCRMQRAR